MRLNNELIRKILLKTEEGTSGYIVEFEIENFSNDEVAYHVAKLKEGGYLDAALSKVDAGRYDLAYVKELTFKGHQFLDNIRDDSVWNKVKTKAKEVGGKVSISILEKIASSTLLDRL